LNMRKKSPIKKPKVVKKALKLKKKHLRKNHN